MAESASLKRAPDEASDSPEKRAKTDDTDSKEPIAAPASSTQYQSDNFVIPVVGFVQTQPPPQNGPKPIDYSKYKTKMCKNYLQTGACNFGPNCMFAHGDRELMTFVAMSQMRPKAEPVKSDPTKWKTKLCKHFVTNGSCPFMEKCGFAHGPHELMPPGAAVAYGANTYPGFYGAPPTTPSVPDRPAGSLAKTRLCKSWMQTGTCAYPNCTFAHGQHELRPRDGAPAVMPAMMPPVMPPAMPPGMPMWPAWPQYGYS
jgi:hypothetical protein